MKNLVSALLLATLFSPFCLRAHAQDLPHLQKKDGRFAMVVDGKPFFILGAQIGNSSSWPVSLPNAWRSLEALHVNTVEAPVYWQQMEPAPDKFDFTNVDLLVNQAREHNVHLVLLWFGTWKNGQNHYVPDWIKTDPQKYPREENAYGKLLDVMSPNSPVNMEADIHAFSALMHHLRETDSTQHTVIMIQVENESGSVGSVRDFTPAAQKIFDGQVPSELATALHLPQGTWSKTFGPDADEYFAAYSTAHYINEVGKAGKAEYPLPMYCNVWITYPVAALENRNRPSPGQEYPSGGPQQANIPIWKAAAPSIDILAPDFYFDASPSSAASSPPTSVPTTRSLSPKPTRAIPSDATSSTPSAKAPSASLPLASITPSTLPPPAQSRLLQPRQTMCSSSPWSNRSPSLTLTTSCKPPSRKKAPPASRCTLETSMPSPHSASRSTTEKHRRAPQTFKAEPSSHSSARSSSS